MQDTIVKLTKKLVLYNKLYENLRGFTYTIHTNTQTQTQTMDAILCMVPRLATVVEQTWRQVAGRLYTVSAARIHTGSYMCMRTPPEVRHTGPDG